MKYFASLTNVSFSMNKSIRPGNKTALLAVITFAHWMERQELNERLLPPNCLPAETIEMFER